MQTHRTSVVGNETGWRPSSSSTMTTIGVRGRSGTSFHEISTGTQPRCRSAALRATPTVAPGMATIVTVATEWSIGTRSAFNVRVGVQSESNYRPLVGLRRSPGCGDAWRHHVGRRTVCGRSLGKAHAGSPKARITNGPVGGDCLVAIRWGVVDGLILAGYAHSEQPRRHREPIPAVHPKSLKCTHHGPPQCRNFAGIRIVPVVPKTSKITALCEAESTTGDRGRCCPRPVRVAGRAAGGEV